jgi:hypothetical protein
MKINNSNKAPLDSYSVNFSREARPNDIEAHKQTTNYIENDYFEVVNVLAVRNGTQTQISRHFSNSNPDPNPNPSPNLNPNLNPNLLLINEMCSRISVNLLTTYFGKFISLYKNEISLTHLNS